MPEATTGAASEPDRIRACQDFVWKTHEYINNYIRFADTKAAFTFAWATSLLGGLYLSKAHQLFIPSGLDLCDFFRIPTLAVVAFVLLALSALIAAWSIIPRLPTKQLAGFIFWESILVHANGNLYTSSLLRLTDAELLEHMAVQLYTLAEVARAKYRPVRISMWLAFLGSISAGGVLLWK